MRPAHIITASLCAACLGLAMAGPAAGQSMPGKEATTGRGLTSPGETDSRQERIMSPHAWLYPNFGVDPAVRSDRVYLAFPQDKALFKTDTGVTLGWQPVTEPTVTVVRYEIFVAADNGYVQYVKPGEDAAGKPTSALFFPPGPGRYFWQVWAVLSNGLTIASLGREFEVVQ